MTTRTPLRPLARVLDARERGENPDRIERENLRRRREEMRDRFRLRSEGRLLVLAGLFLCAFIVVGFRMGELAASEPREPSGRGSGASIAQARADIVDRRGRVLATNMLTRALYAQPPLMVDKPQAARELARIFPDLDEEKLLEQFTGNRKFIWIKRKISPEQQQAVHDIGEPGLLFGPREMRLYPNGPIAAHVLGGARFGEQGVNAAEIVGVAGVEKFFDDRLRDPARAQKPLMLSLDLTVQAAIEEVLAGGMSIMGAKGAAAILMDVRTGEVLALVSLPDFDPNARPRPQVQGSAADSPLFNRAVQGVYELGSVFKIFTAAQAMELGLLGPDSMVATQGPNGGPLKWGRFTIKDFHDYGPELSLTDVIVKSSNIGAANVARMIGPERQQEFMRRLGFLDATPFEMPEARQARPLKPANWSELSAMTISYGHGISVSPLHLAAAYAAMVNGGTRVTPTLLRQEVTAPGPRVISQEVSDVLRAMLRQVVVRGTASFGDVPGYRVGGKTGTADKPKEDGSGYMEQVISTFAGVFPSDDPAYVLTVTFDEPEIFAAGETRRTAGWTAVPVAAEIIRRVAPLLGLKPEIANRGQAGITLVSR